MTVHALVPQCAEPESDVLSYLECKRVKEIFGCCPWISIGKACNFLQTPQLHNGFSPHYACQKTGITKKLLDMALMVPAENKAKHISLANHTTKTIYHHHHHALEVGCKRVVWQHHGQMF